MKLCKYNIGWNRELDSYYNSSVQVNTQKPPNLHPLPNIIKEIKGRRQDSGSIWHGEEMRNAFNNVDAETKEERDFLFDTHKYEDINEGED
jgi:hypothetical protein